jgi:heat shock protein HslJ
MRKAWLLVPITVIAVALGAGVGSAQSSPLTANAWTLASLLGKAPLAATEPTAAFPATGNVSGSAGCNHYSGHYTSSGSTLRISSLISTQMACATKIMAQESVFLKALSSTRSYAVSGSTLTLRSAAGKTLMTFKAQSQALAGTSWNVTAYNNGKQGVESVLPSPKLTAVFDKAGNLSGFAGCNNYNATYKATAPKISIGPVSSTRKECTSPAGVMTQELHYLTALHTAATYRIEGSRLELRTATGALAAQFTRK